MATVPSGHSARQPDDLNAARLADGVIADLNRGVACHLRRVRLGRLSIPDDCACRWCGRSLEAGELAYEEAGGNGDLYCDASCHRAHADHARLPVGSTALRPTSYTEEGGAQ